MIKITKNNDLSGDVHKMGMFKRSVCLIMSIVMLSSVFIFQNIGVAAYSDGYDDFLNALGYRESSNRYNAKNQYGYLGRWQLGKSALKDIGFMDAANNWTALAAEYGVTSEESFLNTPAAQDYAVYAYHKKLWTYLVKNGASEYIGQTFQGVTVTVAALVGASHLVGASAVKNMLANGSNPVDGNGTTALSYMQLLSHYNITLSITGVYSPENTLTAYEKWKVTCTGGINVRSGPSTSNSIVMAKPTETSINITEFCTDGSGNIWGRIPEGWCAVYYGGEYNCTYMSGGLYTVSYDANGGQGAPAPQKKSGAMDLILSGTAPSRDGYTFLGWSHSPAAAIPTYYSAGNYSLNITATLYAVWKKNGEVSFKDVSPDSWFYDAVVYTASNGLLLGTTPDTFSPDVPMTRAMLVTVLYRMAGSPYVDASNSFSDVPADSYYAQPIAWAHSKGIVNGIGDNKFNPNANITRQDMAKIICLYALYRGYGTEGCGELTGFADYQDVASYAEVSMSWAVGNSIITGADGYLLPKGYATRAQVSTIIMRFRENIGT